MSYEDNDAAGGWGGYDSSGYSREQDNPGIDHFGGSNNGHNDYSNMFAGIPVKNTPVDFTINADLEALKNKNFSWGDSLKSALKGASIGGKFGLIGAAAGAILNSIIGSNKSVVNGMTKDLVELGYSEKDAKAVAKDYVNGVESGDIDPMSFKGNPDAEDTFNANFENFIKSNQSQVNTIISTGKNDMGIPTNLMGGINDYVTKSDQITGDYNTKANALWDDYLEFEKTYFDKYQDVQDTYQDNIASLPQMDLKVPDSMGGAVIPLAPKVHSNMYGNQARTMSDLVGNQGNTALAGMSSRNSINNNMFNTNQTGLNNSFMPTQTALDLYKMERAGELGINQIEAGMPEGPSTLEKWAPVVGSLLSTNDSGDTNLESAWDFVSDFFN